MTQKRKNDAVKIRDSLPEYTPLFEVYIPSSPDYKPSNHTYRSSCSIENLDDLEMEQVCSGKCSEVQMVQDITCLHAATGVVESSDVCPDSYQR